MSGLFSPAARLLAELAARSAEGQRLARGRRYQRQRHVVGLQVETGLVVARVLGSRADPYEVSIACKRANENERRAAEVDTAGAVPGPGDIAFTCICPDWGDPCKHGVAVMLQFAQEVDDDASLLLLWRSLDDLTPPAPAGSEPPGTSAVEPPPPPRSVPGANGPVPGTTDLAPDPPSEPTPLDEFFRGGMPQESGTLIGPLEELQLDAYAKVRIPLEKVDAGPVFADAIEAIAEYWLQR